MSGWLGSDDTIATTMGEVLSQNSCDSKKLQYYGRDVEYVLMRSDARDTRLRAMGLIGDTLFLLKLFGGLLVKVMNVMLMTISGLGIPKERKAGQVPTLEKFLYEEILMLVKF